MDYLKGVSVEWINFFKKYNIIEDINKILNKIDNFENVLPLKEDIFRVFKLTTPNSIRVVILGQDPYHNIGQANGIAFSVHNDIKTPPSLKNIFKELKNDLNIDHSQNNDLTNWVKQGVFLLNACLTVEKHKPNSHKDLGWNKVIINILNHLNEENKKVIYCLWGNYAKTLYNNLKEKSDYTIFSAHPSPLSYYKGFENSKPFSKINDLLEKLGDKAVNWAL